MSNSKTIAKNTLFLYFRMLFVMAVSLYTARVVLQQLGVEDFGIYNLVAGIVIMFSFLNNALTSATQRFINVELVNGDYESIRKTFSASITAHILISIIVLVLGETIGLWFFRNKLNIPFAKIDIAIVVYHVSLLTAIVSLIRVPYYALIIAKEKMSFFAILGVIEVVLKLIVVYLLYLFGNDKLIGYAILLLLVSIIINLFYYVYCRYNFREEVRYNLKIKDHKLRAILSFSGWSLFGNISVVFSNQGIAIILNLFFGVLINGAMGIANQVSSAVYSFVSNLQIAFMPRITQSYAEKKIDEHKRLIIQTSRFSFFLLIILVCPILVHTEDILNIWLGNYPNYTVPFVQLILLSCLIDALAGPFWMSINAIGNIKKYQVVLSCINFICIPISYVLLYAGFEAYSVLVCKLLLNLVSLTYRYCYVTKIVLFDKKDIKQYFLSLCKVVILVGLFVYFYRLYRIDVTSNIWMFIVSLVFVVFSVLVIVFLAGINLVEKNIVKNRFVSILKYKF